MSDQFGMPMVDCRPTHEVITELRQQVTLLREPLIRIDEVAKTSKTIISVAAATWKMLDKIRTALDATKEQ